MLDHIGLTVADMERARAFYQSALKPLGVDVVMEVTADETGGDAHAGFGKDGQPFFWIGTGAKPMSGTHVAFAAGDARRGRRLLPRGAQRRARPQAPLSPELLRRLRPRQQHRGRLPHAGAAVAANAGRPKSREDRALPREFLFQVQ